MKKVVLLAAIFLGSFSLFAQEDLLSFANDSTQKKPKDYTIATFKATRLVNFHTIETQSKRTLDFRISHRFGDFSSGAYQAYGLDGAATIKLSLEYCFDGRFQIGLGRANDQKMWDGFAKYALLKQTTDNSMPISLTVVAGAYYTFMADPNASLPGGVDMYHNPVDRLSFCDQFMVARKFSRRFSFQVGGAFVHYNIVQNARDQNDSYFATVATRFKVTQRFALTAEYAFSLNRYSDTPYYNSGSVGFDLETGGHVFQIAFSNSTGLNEPIYFARTDKDWMQAQVRIGFNISRVFAL
jgi:hypothetical protein